MSDNNAALLAVVEKLTAQLRTLDKRPAKLEARQGIPEENLVAIGATVIASLGHKAKVWAVRFSAQSDWVRATREQSHNRTVPHVRWLKETTHETKGNHQSDGVRDWY